MENSKRNFYYYHYLNCLYNSILKFNKLTANQLALYHALLFVANKSNSLILNLPLKVLKQYTGLNKEAVLYSRKALQKKGLITFKQQPNLKATEYTINKITFLNR